MVCLWFCFILGGGFCKGGYNGGFASKKTVIMPRLVAENLISREAPVYIMHGFNYTLPEHVRRAVARRNRSILEASKDPKNRRRINHLALFSIVIPKGQIYIM